MLQDSYVPANAKFSAVHISCYNSYVIHFNKVLNYILFAKRLF